MHLPGPPRRMLLPRPSLRRAGAAALALLLALCLVGDVRVRLRLSPLDARPYAGDWVPVWSGGLIVLLAAAALLGRRSRTAGAAVTAAAVSLVASAAYVHLPVHMLTSEVGGAEIVGLLVLVAMALRSSPPYRAAGAAAAVGTALGALPTYRDPHNGDGMMYALGLACVVGWGLVLRLLQAQRQRIEQLVRQEERLALARDLHDTVAHQVTGIVVHTQAARHMARNGLPDPDTLAKMLIDIESAGSAALTSMRQLVGTLREERPGHEAEPLARILGPIVEQSRARGLPVHLDTGDRLPETIPAEVGGALSRVAQEALTNAQRYARGARSVDVTVRLGEGNAELLIEDDGHGPHPAQRVGIGSGYGIIGMRERIELLGGRFEAGPRPDGGWRVRASVPLNVE